MFVQYITREITEATSLIVIFLDSKLRRLNSQVAKLDWRLDSLYFQGLRIESHEARVAVKLLWSATVVYNKLICGIMALYLIHFT